METTRKFMEMGARHALLGQVPDGFERRGDRKSIVIAQYNNGGVDPYKFQVCYEGKCIPLLTEDGKDEPSLDSSFAKIKRMALDFLTDSPNEPKERGSHDSVRTDEKGV